jgi:hypothetical protein
MVVGALTLAVCGGTPAALAGAAAPHGSGGGSPMVAPYLDMANYQPANLYAAVRKDHLRDFSAGFVIGKGCTPTWDDSVPVKHNPPITNAIKKAKSLGAQVIVSFGGQGGTDLARSCTSAAKVLAGYKAVVKQLHPTYVDFDIEGPSLAAANAAASQRRLVAIAGLEKADPKLIVSLTEPVLPSGLQGSVKSLLRRAKADHVRVNLLNLMTMDYYTGSPIEMGSAAISAAKHSLPQLRKVWPRSTYANLGITPMIGVNDDASETFTLADAARVTTFARAHHVGRLAFWALGRDGQCATPETTAQYNCSSVAQSSLAYTRAFLK